MNTTKNNTVIFRDIGKIEYGQAWDYQLQLFNEILEIKKHNRDTGSTMLTPNYLLFCEHPHVYTLGKSGSKDHLLVSTNQLNNVQAAFYHTSRGGDITYHGPGQLVAYPIFDLENFFTDIHVYMRTLEECVIQTLQKFEILTTRLKGLPGVWIDDNTWSRKICAMGVKTSRWVTMHGLALNVNTDLSYFNHIVPCGLVNKGVTSMEHERKIRFDFNDVKEVLKTEIALQFGLNFIAD